MDAKYPLRFCSFLLLPVLMNAQLLRPHDPVALKHWAAPLYWQPAQTSAGERTFPTAPNATGAPTNASPLVFVAMQPCRVVDTRSGSTLAMAFGPPSLSAGDSRTFPILSSTTCNIPATAQAYSFEITVIPPGPLAYVTAFPTGQSNPVAAIAVESPQGVMASNTGIIPAGVNGSVDIYANNATDIVIDINGYYASITNANANTALGTGALANNTTGNSNTASGFGTLGNNTVGEDNTAGGYEALGSNTSGSLNTATGNGALGANTTGGSNTAMGQGALGSNTTGNENTAVGASLLGEVGALGNNTTGSRNTAIGNQALKLNMTGNSNIAIGYQAAFNVGAGNSGNIHIGSQGASADSNTIRIGGSTADTAPQNKFFAAGIRGTTTGNNDAIPVVIDSNGQLGTVSSSIRFKEDVHDMADASSGLMQLRPVTFRYEKPFADGSKPIQYGLIAEEVEEVFPDLVAHSVDGQIESVKYQVLDSMLLNELQKEHQRVQQQSETIRLLESRLAAVEEAVRAKP